MKNEKPVRRASATEQRKIDGGGKRVPGGVLSAEAAANLARLVDAEYASSRLQVIERALDEARKRVTR